MDLESKLKNEGWYLTEAGIKKLQNSCTNVENQQNVQKLIEIAKNLDFRDIAGGALPVKRDGDFIPGNIVLQLQRLRVVSAPKANEDSRAAPRFLQLELSDGQSTIMALEMEHISVLNTDIPPGVKLLLRPKQLKLIQGTIELFNTDVKVLGGDVESLAEKWRMARSMQKYARSGRPMTGASGPPPWIAFGKKLELNKDELPNERNFKSLQAASERDKESKENDEFNAMRSEAIAMASKASSRKTFGGGGQVLLDHNLKKILEKGYSEEEAKDALRSTNNNLERALYNLKRRHGGAAGKSGSFESNSRGTGPTSARGNSNNPREGGGGRRNAKEDTLDVKPATTNVSLFDFLSDKFAKPSEAETSSTSALTNPTNNTSGRNHSAQQNNDRDAGINNQPSAKSKTNQRDNKDKSSNCTNIKANTNSKNGININRNQAAKDERPKFENNISSSFNANRHHHASGRREPRSGGAQVSERSSGHETSHHREANYARNARGGNNTDQRKTSNLSKPQYPEDQRIMSREFRSERGQRGSRGYVEANNRRETTRYFGDRDNTEKVGGGSEVRSKTFGGREQNEQQPTKRGGENEHRHGGRNQQQKQAFTNNNPQDINKLIESTGNLRIDNKVQQPSHSATSAPKQHLAATPHAQHGKSQPQQYIPNGLPYDSGKKQIKQEYPMNVANSQNLNLNTMPSGQSVTTVAAKGSRTVQNVPVSGAPNHNYLHPSQTSQQQAPKVMQPSWQWKVGDRCLAKYWDDGGFYEAEITGVADTTCVVLYLGYGNHEEVLKTDCLPIQDFIQRPQQHQPQSSHQHHQSSQNHPQQQMIFQSLPHGPENGGVPDGNMRYNNNNNNNKKVNYQLLYVPPPKRKN